MQVLHWPLARGLRPGDHGDGVDGYACRADRCRIVAGAVGDGAASAGKAVCRTAPGAPLACGYQSRVHVEHLPQMAIGILEAALVHPVVVHRLTRGRPARVQRQLGQLIYAFPAVHL
jgi:hypothetical protein